MIPGIPSNVAKNARIMLAKFVSNYSAFFPKIPKLTIKDVTTEDIRKRIEQYIDRKKYNYIPRMEDYFHALLDDSMLSYAADYPNQKETACLWDKMF